IGFVRIVAEFKVNVPYEDVAAASLTLWQNLQGAGYLWPSTITGRPQSCCNSLYAENGRLSIDVEVPAQIARYIDTAIRYSSNRFRFENGQTLILLRKPDDNLI